MAKLSIILPIRSEYRPVVDGMTILQRTVKDIYDKATGDFEVIVAFDGGKTQALRAYPTLTVLYMSPWQGTKVVLNSAAELAKGKYIMKADGHCMFSEGFDEVLQEGMQDNWIVMPRFYVLDAENWRWQDERFYDYFMLPCPFTYKRGIMFQAGGHWKERTRERFDVYPWDENMKLHGSCWMTSRDYYLNTLGGLDYANGAGTWNGEDIELTMKAWLGSGKIMVNKAAWYAHMHRGGQRPREWGFSYREAYRSAAWTADYWLSNSWEGRSRDIEWLIEKFMPIPGWPDDWRERLKQWRLQK